MKVMRVYVAPELIAMMLTKGYVLAGKLTISEGLPEGAALVGVGYDLNRRAWGLDFQHESFRWIDSGAEPPILNVIAQKDQQVLSDALSE